MLEEYKQLLSIPQASLYDKTLALQNVVVVTCASVFETQPTWLHHCTYPILCPLNGPESHKLWTDTRRFGLGFTIPSSHRLS